MKKDNKPQRYLRQQPNNDNLLPRDISESLGKLPPQALDLETEVLGAIMLEKNALSKVIPFLKADHFYKESHSEIYQAIIDLHSASEPIDMKTVVNQLRKTAKIDIVGGHMAIVDLTDKVSSSANIVYHARVIVEMAVKRFAIQVASKIHHDAYEDTTDAFELLDRSEAAIKTIRDTTLVESGRSKIEALWATTHIVEKPEDDRQLISIQGTTVCSSNNHSMISGKKKSRKTLFVTMLIKDAIKTGTLPADRILLFDTEQGKSHVYKVRLKIYKMTGHWIPIFYLRGMSCNERQEFIKSTVEFWKVNPWLIVIDGIRDLVSNINDPDECTNLIVWLEKLTLQHGLHVINVLHLNKTDGNVRGHIGSELENKAQTVIKLENDDSTGSTIIKCEVSRDKPFETFAFTHGQDDLPEVVGVPIKGGVSLPEDENRKRLITIFEEGDMGFADLVKKMIIHFSAPNGRALAKNKAERMIQEFRRLGFIAKHGPDKSPKSVYKLMISADGKITAPPPGFVTIDQAKANQAALFEQNGHENGTKSHDHVTETEEIVQPSTLNDDGTDETGEFNLF